LAGVEEEFGDATTEVAGGASDKKSAHGEDTESRIE
jgi:hypothetical protein